MRGVNEGYPWCSCGFRRFGRRRASCSCRMFFCPRFYRTTSIKHTSAYGRTHHTGCKLFSPASITPKAQCLHAGLTAIVAWWCPKIHIQKTLILRVGRSGHSRRSVLSTPLGVRGGFSFTAVSMRANVAGSRRRGTFSTPEGVRRGWSFTAVSTRADVAVPSRRGIPFSTPTGVRRGWSLSAWRGRLAFPRHRKRRAQAVQGLQILGPRGRSSLGTYDAIPWDTAAAPGPDDAAPSGKRPIL